MGIIRGFRLSNIPSNLTDLLVENAYANSIPGPSCITGEYRPIGVCAGGYFVDDDSSDGQYPSLTTCTMFNTYACHFDGMRDHITEECSGMYEYTGPA